MRGHLGTEANNVLTLMKGLTLLLWDTFFFPIRFVTFRG